ncbi:unnamed protein product [Psylliodes chrysocephalus]|uniref:Uncharacterized protein n=1 Tax=Psylliodes chrysocephalus TaxID=3402493 RepID=A0A9P0G4L0_9CUCU|nr:unnamed protein product [Psylliodes chrysocephala]
MGKIYIIFLVLGINALNVSAKLNICLHLWNEVEGNSQSDTNLLNSNDPIFVKDFPLSFNHSALRLDGDFKNISIWNMTYTTSTYLQNGQFINLTFPNISLVGDYYSMKGRIGDLFDIWGEGDFWCYLYDFSVSFSILPLDLNTTDFCVPVSIDVDLQKIQIHFNNLMDGTDVGDLFNKGFCTIIPEIIRGVWQEIKEANDAKIEEVCDGGSRLLTQVTTSGSGLDGYQEALKNSITSFINETVLRISCIFKDVEKDKFKA